MPVTMRFIAGWRVTLSPRDLNPKRAVRLHLRVRHVSALHWLSYSSASSSASVTTSTTRPRIENITF